MKKKIFLYIVLTFLFLTGAYRYRVGRFQKDISREILRFHVLANSDDEADQSVKLKVRDEIGRYMQDKLQGVEDLTECMQVAEANLSEIIKIADGVITERGYNYAADAKITSLDFPEKQYGNYVFPEGTYQALEVTLGEGSGHNWWCVMYPNMCFSGSVYEVIEEDAKEELKVVLTPEEYEELMAESNISLKFKYWEKIKEFWEKLEDKFE